MIPDTDFFDYQYVKRLVIQNVRVGTHLICFRCARSSAGGPRGLVPTPERVHRGYMPSLNVPNMTKLSLAGRPSLVLGPRQALGCLVPSTSPLPPLRAPRRVGFHSRAKTSSSTGSISPGEQPAQHASARQRTSAHASARLRTPVHASTPPGERSGAPMPSHHRLTPSNTRQH